MQKFKKNTLVYPRQYFVENLGTLKKKGEMLLTVSLNETTSENQWLVRKTDEVSIEFLLNSKRKKNGIKSKHLLLRSTLLKNRLHPDCSALRADFLTDGHLYLNYDPITRTNGFSGYFNRKGHVVSLDELLLVGSRMQRLTAVNSTLLTLDDLGYHAFLESRYAKTRWQMTRKALGRDVWKRMCLLRVLIVGGGRSGEAAFLELARSGVGCIRVCDADNLELGNIGEMKLASDADIGLNKADIIVRNAIALRKTDQADDCFCFRAIPGFNFDGEAHEAAKACDVIICCVDSDGGRDYASYIASRYYKVLIDIGTGVDEADASGVAGRGYDVRMILPGDGCLRCCGGLDEAQAELEIFNRSERRRQRADGRRLRGGSLRTLNVAAVNEGIALLQDLCRGDVERSTWVQFDRARGRTVVSPIPRIKEECDCNQSA